ncbi:MAG: hypothetical protein ACLFP9_06595 [Desulfonatronovibrio sp.]
MGELIQIRVTAGIHDKDKALKRWSGLAGLAFGPQLDRDFTDRDLLKDLTDALYDKERLGQLPQDSAALISKDIKTAHSLAGRLYSLLADRSPAEADKVSYKLEDLLDQMEENLK